MYYFYALIENKFFNGLKNYNIYSENCQVIFCDNYHSLFFSLNSFVICYFDIVYPYDLNSFCFYCMRNF